MKRSWDDAFSATPAEFHRRVALTLSRIEEDNMKRRSKLSMGLIMLAIVLALAGGAALATGNVFGWAAQRYADDELNAHFARLNELADAQVQTAVSADGAQVLELTQNYYDGDVLCVAYRLSGLSEADAIDAEFEPDAELRARIKSEGAPVDELTSVYGAEDESVRALLEDLARREFTGDDWACIAVYGAFLSDHAFVTVDGERVDVVYCFDGAKLEGDVLTGYREYRVGEDEYALPASDGAQQITYEMALNRQVWYYYRDASGFYTLSERLAKEPFEFTVRRIEQPQAMQVRPISIDAWQRVLLNLRASGDAGGPAARVSGVQIGQPARSRLGSIKRERICPVLRSGALLAPDRQRGCGFYRRLLPPPPGMKAAALCRLPN